MIIMLYGIILAVFLTMVLTTDKNGTPSQAAFSIPALVITLSILIGLKAPLSGYGEWEEKGKEELLPLSTSELVYVYEEDNAYIYKLPTTPQFETEELNKQGKTVIQVQEDENCTIPILTKYERDAIKSLWTFAWNTSEYKYAITVPEGTVVSDF